MSREGAARPPRSSPTDWYLSAPLVMAENEVEKMLLKTSAP